MFEAGELIAGKFQVDRVIGVGGMGLVVAATHVHLGQRVALKFLRPDLATDRAVVERFLREARASAQLRGEHICRVSDVGVLDGGAPYFVMELLDGRDLASVLAAHGPIPVPNLADYVVQACVGLAEAHAAQIVHRDLKPANLFLTHRPDGAPLLKIVDFGIAKDSTSVNVHLTRTDAVMGSPGYMSPEQLRSSRIADARSDVWALGVILFELSTGRPPFTAESITDLALRIAIDPTPALRGPSIPAGFDQVVYRCLEKDPARRFPDVAQLAAALAPFGGPATRDRALSVARMLSTAPGAAGTAPTVVVSAAPTTLGSSATSLERAPGGRLRWGIPLGALAAGVLATVAVVKLRGEPHAAAVVDPATTHPTMPAGAAIERASVPSPSAVLPDALPADAAPPIDAAGPVDAAPADAAVRPDAALPVRKVTRPRPAPRAGPDDDLSNSRL
jgi:eukaryotic-like serine/threonine-protein kinase